MKVLDQQSDEQEVRELLDALFGHLNDASAQRFAEHNNYLRKPGRGKPRDLAYVEMFRRIANRTENLTIGDAIDGALPLVELPPEKNENMKRGFHRHKKRTHPLLNASRFYNEKDFADTVLAKDFNIAAAISTVCSDNCRSKIFTLLNEIALNSLD
jgi:hypothetical protein